MTEDATNDLERTAKEVVRDVIGRTRSLVDLEPRMAVDERASVGRQGEDFMVRVIGLDQPVQVRPCDMPS